MINKDTFVSVVAVLSNDADILDAFLKDADEVLRKNYENYELVLVDDGSEDGTPVLAEKLFKEYDCVRYIRLSRKFGMEAAMSAGLDTAIGDVLVVLEPETDPPAMIPLMVEEVRGSNCVVFHIKKNRNKNLPLWYRMGKSFYYFLSRLLFKFYPPEDAGFFIGLSRQHLNSLTQYKDRARFLRVFSSQIGYGTKKLYYEAVSRRTNPRQKKFFESLAYFVNAIATNSTAPLRFVVYVGFLAATLNVLYAGYVFIFHLFRRTAEGWMTLSLQNAVMFFLLFIMLTVFAEYLLRLTEESRGRPLYFIVEEKNSSVMVSDLESKRNIKNDST